MKSLGFAAVLIALAATVGTGLLAPLVAGQEEPPPDEGVPLDQDGDESGNATLDQPTPPTYSPQWLAFDVVEGAFALHNVTYAGALVLHGLAVSASAPSRYEDASWFALEAPEASLWAGDAEEAYLSIETRGEVEVRLRLTSGAVESDGSWVGLELDGVRLDLVTYGNATPFVEDDAIRVAASTGGFVELRMAPAASPEQEAEAEAFRDGDLGAEVTLVEGQTPLVVEHHGVEALGTREDGGIVLLVSARDAGPRTFVLALDPALFEEGRLTVTLDGVPVAPASSHADAADPTDDAEAEYFVTDEDGTRRVLVSLPSVGTHAIRVQSVGAVVLPRADPLAPWALGASLGVAVILGLALVRRRT